ncbi:D-xylulokinase [Scheffersomyces stipitis CBS 6054]|uniref:Xylulose kinase n=1 Tax=Scheffersomyces stipitis (strain ATCC 58785 / CBS 6054 / NBRC 10063 / NRRL Y-11545) TaxID=322104 RepID=A3GF74_PICST|nr:D-xylulokinase [Scheffersomyces stipitis CBS 6054]EAZ63302.2 D-xylulokinase [Scheffersomyces stipitis CBS 6054]KZV11993.1 PsXyl3 [Saccharomyces cerevisiae]
MTTTPFDAPDKLFLGFDLSTQQLKIIVTDENLAALKTYNVEFDSINSSVQKGVIAINDEISKGAIISPVYMWLDALDHVFEDMKKDGFPFNKVVGISGSCQQHGSVYWSRTAEKVLSELDAESSLSSQMRSAFTFKHAPNWQDHSTGKELEEFERVIGADALADISGSRAHYRFTGLQIRKLSTRFKPEKYNRTARISLVSSFVASVLLGRITSIEEADACGMNLYDIEKREFNEELLAIAAGVHPELDGVEQDGEIYRAGINELKRKLGPVKPITYESEGDIASYFVTRYGFNPDCKIYSFTGDNLATIISLPLAPNDALISLGTSTTVLIITKNYAPSSQYHLFKHPTMPDHYMGMICYCNGSLAREKVRDEVNEKFNVEDKKSWDKFNEILDKSTDFNNKLGIYFPLGEIVPNAAAQIKRSVLNSKNEIVDVELGDKNWQPEDDVSSIVESQTLSCRLRTGPMLSKSGDSSASSSASPQPEGDGTDLHKVYQDLVKKFGDLYTDGKKQTFESLTARPNRCYYVGGASNNGSIIRKMGSILAPVNGNYKVDIPNACALGGAYKASWSYECEAKKEWIGYDQYINRLFEVSDEMNSFEVKDKWLEYANGVGMLAKMESELKH